MLLVLSITMFLRDMMRRLSNKHLSHVLTNMFKRKTPHLVFRIVHPASVDVPEPVFGPQHEEAVHEDAGVEDEPPARLAELLQRGRLLGLLPLAEPSLHLVSEILLLVSYVHPYVTSIYKPDLHYC